MAERSEAGALYVPLTSDPSMQQARIPRTAEYDETIHKLRRLSEIPEGWDSYGGRAVPTGARQQALRFIASLLTHVDRDEQPRAPAVGPIADGGVLLRWLTDDSEIELAFFESGGEYIVRQRETGEVIDEGAIGRPESLLRDVFREYLAR